MSTMLVDTSVWIDFFNKKILTEQVKILNYLIEDEFNICICPIIYQEILQGIRNDEVYLEIKEYLNSMIILKDDIMDVSNLAIDIYRNYRKSDIKIRKSNDCLIASYAIINDIPILHNDKDFEFISQFTNLKIAY